MYLMAVTTCLSTDPPIFTIVLSTHKQRDDSILRPRGNHMGVVRLSPKSKQMLTQLLYKKNVLVTVFVEQNALSLHVKFDAGCSKLV